MKIAKRRHVKPQRLDDVDGAKPASLRDTDGQSPQLEIDAAVDRILAQRKSRGRITFEDLKSARDAGRKY